MDIDTETPPTVWPTLRARDARALIAFLVDTVGFVELVTYTDDAGTVHHAELAWPPGGGVMLGQERADAEAQVTPPGSFSAYVVEPDPARVDALADRVRGSAGEVVRGPYDTDYGSHDVAIRDPEGNAWHVGTYPGSPRP
jgi:uncharacterized glyoxalase superfamily protein PhnB